MQLFTLNPFLVTGATVKAFVSFHTAPLVLILFRLRADLSRGRGEHSAVWNLSDMRPEWQLSSKMSRMD